MGRSIRTGLAGLVAIALTIVVPAAASSSKLPSVKRLGDSVSLGQVFDGPVSFGPETPGAKVSAPFRFGRKVRAGAVPGSPFQAVVGNTVLDISFARNLRAGETDDIWAELDGWAFSLVQVESVRRKGCRDAVFWNAGDTIFGRQYGVTCRRHLRVRTANPVQYRSIRAGKTKWGFSLESFGPSPVVSQVRVLGGSRISYTKKGYDDIKLESVPATVQVDEGKVVTIPFEVANRGARPSLDASVDIGTIEVIELFRAAEIPETGDGVTPLKPDVRSFKTIAPGQRRKASFRVRGDTPGTHPVWIAASGTASGDSTKVLVEVPSAG